MANKLKNIPNDDTQNYPFCRLQLVVKTFEQLNLIIHQIKTLKVPKFNNPMYKYTLLQNFGD